MRKETYSLIKIIENVILLLDIEGIIYIQTSNFELSCFGKDDLKLNSILFAKERIQSLQIQNNDIYFIEQSSGHIYSSIDLNNRISDKKYFDFFVIDNRLLVISSKLHFSPLRLKRELTELLTGIEIFEMDDIKMFYLLKTSIIFHNDIKLIFYYDIDLNGYKTGSFDFTKVLKKDNKETISKYSSFYAICKYENQFIFAVNDDRIISIDINTRDILWELTDKEVQGSSGYEQVFDGLFFRSTVLGNIIHVLCHTCYMQINIVTRDAKIIKDLNENNLNIKDIVCYSPTLYKNKFYFLFQRDNGRYHVVNEFGIFNTDTCELAQTIKVALPKGHSLNSNPIVDDKYIYLKDSENDLYIFSEEAVDEAELAIFKTIENTNTIENIMEEKEEQVPQETTSEELDIFDGIISPSSYFIDVPDCITQSSDYKSTIEDAFKLTDSVLVLNAYSSKEVNNTFILNITVNAVEEIFTIPFTSKYVEGAALVSQMNILLNKYGNTTTKKFVELTGDDVDFGIAFITEEEKLSLLEEGYIWEV